MTDSDIPATDTSLDRSHVQDFAVEIIILEMRDLASDIMDYAVETHGQLTQSYRDYRRLYFKLYLSVLHRLEPEYVLTPMSKRPEEAVLQGIKFSNMLRDRYGYLSDGLQTLDL